MLAHLRANLVLLVLTVALCCVIYPVTLWGVGQAVFPSQANGSLIYNAEGQAIASRLIAHEVKGDQYFQPRPSATGGSAYNALASGASNYGANNYLLRDRVARSLAPIVKYAAGPKRGQPVAPDVVRWFREERPGLVEDWATAHTGLAQAWVKSDDATKEFVKQWFAERPIVAFRSAKGSPFAERKATIPEPEDLAVAFFTQFSRQHPATWLKLVEVKDDTGKEVKRVELIGRSDPDSGDIASVFFDLWRDIHADVALEDVPADLVTASGSGLDPHITLDAALYQLPRVAAKWAELTGESETKLRGEIKSRLHRHARAPLVGLAGVFLVNVVEINVELHRSYDGKVLRAR